MALPVFLVQSLTCLHGRRLLPHAVFPQGSRLIPFVATLLPLILCNVNDWVIAIHSICLHLLVVYILCFL